MKKIKIVTSAIIITITAIVYNVTSSAAWLNYEAPVLKYGSKGTYVEQLQKDLNTLGYGLSVDSSFGQATLSAVKDFQSQMGLVVDGSVGPATKSSLISTINSFESSTSIQIPGTAAMQRGSRGIRVRFLQKMLTLLGYSIDIDGSFGPATEETVRSFQRDHGLTVDGSCGPETINCLNKLIISGYQPIQDKSTVSLEGTIENETGISDAGKLAMPSTDINHIGALAISDHEHMSNTSILPDESEIEEEFKRIRETMYLNRSTYKNYCSAFVKEKLTAMGIFNGIPDLTVSEAKQWYDELYEKYGNSNEQTSGGYKLKLYEGNGKSVEEWLKYIVYDEGYNQNILFCFHQASKGSKYPYAGHVVLINYVKDDVVFYSDSYAQGDIREGDLCKCSISEFSQRYWMYGRDYGGAPKGVAIFYK